MRSLLQLFTALFFVSSLPALAQDSAPPDNATSKSAEVAGEVEILDSDVDILNTDLEPAEEPFPLAGRIAFGVVNATGGRRSGSNNWSATYDSERKYYEISIRGHDYNFSRYTTVVTPVGSAYCTTSSSSNKLRVYCWKVTGTGKPPAISRRAAYFSFVTFR